MFSLWCIDWVGSLYANRFLCISVLRVASGPRVKLASCKSALNPPVVCSTDRSKAVLVLLFVAFLFILLGDLLYVFPCVILFLCFSVLLVLRLPRLGKRELILMLFVRLFDLCLFGFVGFLFLLVSGKGCGLWLWHSLDFSLTFSYLFLVTWEQCRPSRHIAIITANQAFDHVEWYGTKLMAKSVDPDQSPRLVYTIQLYRFFFAILLGVKVSYCLHVC